MQVTKRLINDFVYVCGCLIYITVQVAELESGREKKKGFYFPSLSITIIMNKWINVL